jgi:hypothetical protein
MRCVLVRYRVKSDRAAENEHLVKRVFEQLARETPDGLRYFTFKLDDGVSFVHVALDERADGTSTLGKLSAFKEFGASIAERCEEKPVTTELTLVGAYVAPAELRVANRSQLPGSER